MKHISEVLAAILPSHLDGIRELSPDDRAKLQEQVNRWAGAKYFGPVNGNPPMALAGMGVDTQNHSTTINHHK